MPGDQQLALVQHEKGSTFEEKKSFQQMSHILKQLGAQFVNFCHFLDSIDDSFFGQLTY